MHFTTVAPRSRLFLGLVQVHPWNKFDHCPLIWNNASTQLNSDRETSRSSSPSMLHGPWDKIEIRSSLSWENFAHSFRPLSEEQDGKAKTTKKAVDLLGLALWAKCAKIWLLSFSASMGFDIRPKSFGNFRMKSTCLSSQQSLDSYHGRHNVMQDKNHD